MISLGRRTGGARAEPRGVEPEPAFELRRHGVVLVRPLLRALALGAAGGAVVVLVPRPAVQAVGAVVLAVGAVVALRAVARWDRTRIVVTPDTLLVVRGVLGRSSAAVPLNRIGVVEVDQTLSGRLLGYGTLVAGELEIPYVPRPREVARLLG
jgi:membrane protein YdbS with pleckstrin-like domain